MAIQKVAVVIKGISPLLMHAYPMVAIEALEKKSPEEQAAHAAYKTPDGQLYIPAVALQRACIGAAAYSKGKGRASLAKIAAACLMVGPEYMILTPQSYIIDPRPVVIPATKGRVMRYRPRFNEWTVSFGIEFEDTLVTEAQVRKILDDCGQRVGLLDFRPACKGPFGRFIVTQWTT